MDDATKNAFIAVCLYTDETIDLPEENFREHLEEERERVIAASIITLGVSKFSESMQSIVTPTVTRRRPTITDLAMFTQ